MASKTVLVVDDNDLNRKLLEGVLQIVQAKALFAKDGAEGVRLAKIHHPDLILLDVQLPDIDGFEVVAQMHKEADLATIPYFYLTGNITAECRRQADAEGCLGIVQKPIAVTEFIETLKKVLA
jgi:two-component system, cell cycle response regulator DivK